jgi:flagellar basal-body rod protein FlgF
MAGGAYSAVSGMQLRLQELDRIASDLANVSTSGYKTERAGTQTMERDEFGGLLDSAVDVMQGRTKTDFKPGAIATTHNPMDVAINGRGFFAIDTANGTRYTRNGGFTRRADGTLTTIEGDTVLGESGGEIRLNPGAVTIDGDGTVRSGNTVAGKLQVVEFAESDLVHETGAKFRAIPGAQSDAFSGSLVSGALEQSNISAIDRMAALTEVSRGFDMLQRGVSVIFNDVDARAISELGRR